MTSHLRRVLLRRFGAAIQADLDRPGFWEMVKVANGASISLQLETEVRQLAVLEAQRLYERGWKR